MPICFIEGPSGLHESSRKELMEKTLDALVKAYQMPDDRVFIREYDQTVVGHTGQEDQDEKIIQKEPAKPVCYIDVPPGLSLEGKRRLTGEVTDAIASAYQIKDLRDVLIFLREHQIQNVANNGYLQTENPEFSSPVAGV